MALYTTKISSLWWSKYHLKRIIGDRRLDFESFYTILTQVEAIHNSRPRSPLSDDHSELQFLTPGHFLIGSQLLAVPQPYLTSVPADRLKYFEQLQRIVQQVWKVWRTDYLNTLQQWQKWFIPNNNIKFGTFFIIKEDVVSPCIGDYDVLLNYILEQTVWYEWYPCAQKIVFLNVHSTNFAPFQVMKFKISRSAACFVFWQL